MRAIRERGRDLGAGTGLGSGDGAWERGRGLGAGDGIWERGRGLGAGRASKDIAESPTASPERPH